MPKKIEKFENERKIIINKLFEIIGIDQNNNLLSLHKMDNDLEKQQKIIDLESDIKKYFISSRWTCFNKPKNCKRIWLSILKNTLKDMGYEIISSSIVSKIDDYLENGTIYIITLKK